MEGNKGRSPEKEEVLAASPAEASLRLQVTDRYWGDGARYGEAGRPWSRATSCERSKRPWKPTLATSTLPNPAKGGRSKVAVRRLDEKLEPEARRNTRTVKEKP